MPNIHEFWRQQERKPWYRLVKRPDHPRASSQGQVCEHVIIVEAALGHYLPDGAVIHHVDGDARNNAHRNLVACQNQAYHMLLHQRARVVRAGGNPNTQLMCGACGLPKDEDHFAWDNAAHTKRRRRCFDCSRREARRQYQIKRILKWAAVDVEF